MSTFAVFGMNENFAREEARKKVRDFKMEKGKRIDLTMSQWLQAVEDRVVKIMDGKRVVQLSCAYDAPPVCARVCRHDSPQRSLPGYSRSSED